MRYALAAGAASLSLCWGAPALASGQDEKCPEISGDSTTFMSFTPLGEAAQTDRLAIARVTAAIAKPYDSGRYPGMTEAQFKQASATARLIHDEYLKLRAEWIAARNGAAGDIAACGTLDEEITTLRATRAAMQAGDAGSDSLDTIIAAKLAGRTKLITDAKEKIGKAKTAYEAYDPRRRFLVAFAARFPAPAGEVRYAGADPVPQRAERTLPAEPCVIDSDVQRRNLDPNACKFSSQDGARLTQAAYRDNAAEDVPIAGNPVDKRGITVSVVGSQASSELTLSLSDNFRSRWTWTAGEKFQRLTSWGYKIGLTTGGKNGNLLDFNERDDKDRLTNQFDRLDAKTKLSLSLFYADYGNETVTEFDDRSAKFYKAAREACRAAQGKADAFPSTCEGTQLMTWIFAQKDGAYLHGDHAAAFGSLYFAPPPSVKYARWGAGVNVDVARPGFAYKNLPAGATPAELLAAELVKARKFTFTVGPYAFVRMPGSGDRFGWTLIPSLTLKREFDTEDAVTVCPAPAPGSPISLACGDPFLPERPERKTYLVPGLEGRFIFSGVRLGRFYFPQFGLSPKGSYDTDAKRWEVVVPALFAVDSAKSLTAGLSLIHRTGGKDDKGDDRKDETGIAIVVGKTFSLDPF